MTEEQFVIVVRSQAKKDPAGKLYLSDDTASSVIQVCFFHHWSYEEILKKALDNSDQIK